MNAAVERKLRIEFVVGQVVRKSRIILGPLRFYGSQVLETFDEVRPKRLHEFERRGRIVELAEKVRLRQEADTLSADSRAVIEPASQFRTTGIRS